jgi:hypothetical protein
MIEGKSYTEVVKNYFSFLENEFSFLISDIKIAGNSFYDIVYNDKTLAISVNYENISNYVQVIVFILEDGAIPDYDDKTKTFNSSRLNKLIFDKVSKAEIVANNQHFKSFPTNNEIEKKLIKMAKDTRLYLKYCERI